MNIHTQAQLHTKDIHHYFIVIPWATEMDATAKNLL